MRTGVCKKRNEGAFAPPSPPGYVASAAAAVVAAVTATVAAAAAAVAAIAAAVAAIAAAVTAAAAIVVAAAAAIAVAEQQDDDQNDPQIAEIVAVVPHVLFHLTYQSGPYYAGKGRKAA